MDQSETPTKETLPPEAQVAARRSGGRIGTYAAGIAVEILSTIVLMAIALLIAFVGFSLWG